MDEMQLDFYTKSEVDGKLGGLKLLKLSKAAYEALTTKDENTFYIVIDSGSASAYIGEFPISGGSGGGSAANITDDFEVLESGI